MGCEVGGRGEAYAVFEVREEAVQFESDSAGKAARIFGVAEMTVTVFQIGLI